MRLNPRTFNGKMSDGDIRLLRVFCAVVRCGGFAAAESELQLGLPSISRYIKDLETRLGVRLCRRGRVGFSLVADDPVVALLAADDRACCVVDRFPSYYGIVGVVLHGRARLLSRGSAGRTDYDLAVERVVSFDFGKLRGG